VSLPQNLARGRGERREVADTDMWPTPCPPRTVELRPRILSANRKLRVPSGPAAESLCSEGAALGVGFDVPSGCGGRRRRSLSRRPAGKRGTPAHRACPGSASRSRSRGGAKSQRMEARCPARKRSDDPGGRGYGSTKWEQRRAVLEELGVATRCSRLADVFDDGWVLFDAVCEHGLEARRA
jgi:hypothetical protein